MGSNPIFIANSKTAANQARAWSRTREAADFIRGRQEMQILRESLAMSSEAIEAFRKAERARDRQRARVDAHSASAAREMAKAEAKRQRRRERNLMHCGDETGG